MTRILPCGIFAVLFFAALPDRALAQRCVPPFSGLVSWWSGDGNADDRAGANSATQQNGASFRTGLVAEAFSLDGVDDHLRIKDAPDLRFSSALSVDAWVYPTSLVEFPTILGKWDAVEAGQRSYALHLDPNGNVYFRVSPDGGEPGFELGTVISNSTVPLNEWTHVAGTYDGSTLRLYLNGVADNEVAYGGGIFPGGDDLAIGAIVGGVGPGQFIGPFAGLIDEVELANVALTDEQVRALFDAGSAGKCHSTFSTFGPRLDIKFGLDSGGDVFSLGGTFTLAADSEGINPLAEDVLIRIGALAWRIPAGAFTKERQGGFRFEGTIDGTSLAVAIQPSNRDSFGFKVGGRNADLKGATNPPTVGLRFIGMGIDHGDATLRTAEFH